MLNQHQQVGKKKRGNAYAENSLIEMKVYITDKKCDSSVLFPPQLQIGVPKIFSRIIMKRAFIRWSLFISLKLKNRQLVHRGFYFFILHVCRPLKVWSLRPSSPWMVHEDFWPVNWTKLFSHSNGIGFSGVYGVDGCARYLRTDSAIQACPPPNKPQILPGGEDWALATICSAAFPSSSHCWEVAVFGVLACIDCSKLSLVFLILLYPKTKNCCESAPSAPHNCRSLYNNFFRVYLKKHC